MGIIDRLSTLIRSNINDLISRAENPQNPSGLYDRPVLTVDKGTHSGRIWSASADREGRWAVTGSEDKTVRIWSLAEGRLERTIHLPAGPADIGQASAVAISPDGALIAAGGATRGDQEEQIYLFDRSNGKLLQRIEGLPNMIVYALVFSPDGSRLAALVGDRGLRVDPKLRCRRDQMIQTDQFLGRPTHERREHRIGIGNAVVLNHEHAGLRLIHQAVGVRARQCDAEPRSRRRR